MGRREKISLCFSLLVLFGALCGVHAQGGAPKFEVDPTWPKPLPENWVTGQVSGVCVDNQDHVFIVNRNNITAKEAEVSRQAPPFIEFDADGKVVNGFGDWETAPNTTHGCTIDHESNFWTAGNGDRQGDRIQVFDKLGNFKKNIWIKRGRSPPDNWGTIWWIGFSPDREQRYVYVADGGDEQVKILDRASGEVLSSFGRPGHQIGEFTHAHTLAVDSKSNVYVAETDWGRRVQKFKPVD